jgi:hypothetical protein
VTSNKSVTVFGAYGHTGRFVVSEYADRAREGGIVIIPAMAFYGGLGDLLATAAMGDWTIADEICTQGTVKAA